MINKLDLDAPVTFRDLIPEYAARMPVKDMTMDEISRLPEGTIPGWEKTGYLLVQNSRLSGIKHLQFIDFVSSYQVEDDYGYETRYNTQQYLIHVDGQPVMLRDSSYD